ncbi:hypothetical protein BTJ68_01621 [Hortaea werneckii EXF-2000]|uniref:Mago nashi protein n=1 Tax=Hortaea werneckii EXF-2000 TaxID=1157616 RepID=A0A1Z5TQ80_HORWE|nr:hypothetical protein BTJ68_01621 [Hortaea werneckii EXF-2000]
MAAANEPFYLRYYSGHSGRFGHEFLDSHLADAEPREDDTKWPQKNKDGRQELEIRLGSEHISFETAKIGSLVDVNESEDPEGLRVFYYLVQDLKALVFSLISLHFKVRTPLREEAQRWVANGNADQANLSYDIATSGTRI